MKKLLVMLLCLTLVLAFAACNNDVAEVEQPPVEDETATGEWEATPTDLEIDLSQFEGNDKLPDNQQLVDEDLTPVNDLLSANVVLPDSFDISRVIIIDKSIAQVEFAFGGINYTAQYASGLKDNMSGMTKGFAYDETEDVAGLSTRLRWTDGAEGGNNSIGVADCYDSAKNISFMVVIIKGSSKELLISAMEQVIKSVK